jgi:transposase-like protein
MSKKLLVPNRRYTDEFKGEAVRLMDSAVFVQEEQ